MTFALAAAFKSSTVGLLTALPQHQQLILCAMVLRMRRLSRHAEDANEAAARAAAKAAAAGAAAVGHVAAASAVPDDATPGPGSGEPGPIPGRVPVAVPSGADERSVTAPMRNGGPASCSDESSRTALESKAAAAKSDALKAEALAAAGNRCTIAALTVEYSRLCAAQCLSALSLEEVLPLCESLAVSGVLALGGQTGSSAALNSESSRTARTGWRNSGSDPRERAVWLCISQDDLKLATEQLRIFRSILV